MNLHLYHDRPLHRIQCVERKGRGHPDTLADRLAETLSIAYSRFCLQNYGAILRHQFDKLSLMGGKCHSAFGEGHFRSPIRVLVNGRISPGVGADLKPFYDIAFTTVRDFLEAELVGFDFYDNARVLWESTCHGTRGFVDSAQSVRSGINHRFRPRTLSDLPESTSPLSNDTAMGVAWAPLSPLEAAILGLEAQLTSRGGGEVPAFLGTDCKLMGIGTPKGTSLTVSIPLLASHVQNRADYFDKLDRVRSYVTNFLANSTDLGAFEVAVNPGDTTDSECLYIRTTGSCIESGDEGQMGRGNRFGGLISAFRGYSIEAVCGKNPSYHAGKLYSAMAWDIAQELYGRFEVANDVTIMSQIDRPIADPWHVAIRSDAPLPADEVRRIVAQVTQQPAKTTEKFLAARYPIC